MSVKMVFKPRETVDWDTFKEYPPFSIAIDGFCKGAPRSSPDGLRLNINHHEDVDAVATRSSCEQALCHVKLGLYEMFQKDGKPEATLYLNDCDQDIALATYILMYPEQVNRARLLELIDIEDHLDMSAGLFSPNRNSSKLVRQLAWINEGFDKARQSGELQNLDEKAMYALITEAHRRIRSTLYGRGKEIQLDTSFEVIKEYSTWSLVRPIGSHARLGYASKGIKAYVELISEEEGVFRYTLGRLSGFIPFPVRIICLALNEAESIDDGMKGWGGGKNSGGSPREQGSRLSPEDIGKKVEACVAFDRELKEES